MVSTAAEFNLLRPVGAAPPALTIYSLRCRTRRSWPSVLLSSAARAWPAVWWCGTMCTARLRAGGAVAMTCSSSACSCGHVCRVGRGKGVRRVSSNWRDNSTQGKEGAPCSLRQVAAP